jgi:hypothetical protein
MGGRPQQAAGRLALVLLTVGRRRGREPGRSLDLAACFQLNLGGGAARDLMGGGPESFPDRYSAADPMRLLPTGVMARLVHGTADDRVPSGQSSAYAARSRDACDLLSGGQAEIREHRGPRGGQRVDDLEMPAPARAAGVGRSRVPSPGAVTQSW